MLTEWSQLGTTPQVRYRQGSRREAVEWTDLEVPGSYDEIPSSRSRGVGAHDIQETEGLTSLARLNYDAVDEGLKRLRSLPPRSALSSGSSTEPKGILPISRIGMRVWRTRS